MDNFIFLMGFAAILLVVAICVCGAYRVGYVNGALHGAVAERARRDEEDTNIARVTARVEARIEAQLRDEFETELDV